jgi:hypothetical protein
LQPLQLNCAAREEVLADLRYLARRYINWAARIFAILGMAVIEEFIELGRTQWMARNIAHYSTDQTCRHRFYFSMTFETRGTTTPRDVVLGHRPAGLILVQLI